MLENKKNKPSLVERVQNITSQKITGFVRLPKSKRKEIYSDIKDYVLGGATILAYFNTPELTGAKGLFAAGLIGGGTMFMTAFAAATGALCMYAPVKLTPNERMKPKNNVGVAAGILSMAVSYGAVGGYWGYNISKDIVVNGMNPKTTASETIKSSFNHINDNMPKITINDTARPVPNMFKANFG